jgi:hypothetical protein
MKIAEDDGFFLLQRDGANRAMERKILVWLKDLPVHKLVGSADLTREIAFIGIWRYNNRDILGRWFRASETSCSGGTGRERMDRGFSGGMQGASGGAAGHSSTHCIGREAA